MKILLLGADGQLGFELRGPLATFAEIAPRTRADLDLRDRAALVRAIDDARADVIVNAAAWTDVDGAEKDPEGARDVNARAVEAIAERARSQRIGVVHYSTDFVFDGASERPYREDDPTAPLSVYGASKLEGERALSEAPAIVLRTAWVWSLRRKSFVTSILRLARERESLRVVADQHGNPTWARDLASASAMILLPMRADPFAAIERARGVYHLAGSGVVDRCTFARAIVEADPKKGEQKVKQIEPISTAEFPLPAARPKFAPLDCGKAKQAFGVGLPPWEDALGRAMRG